MTGYDALNPTRHRPTGLDRDSRRLAAGALPLLRACSLALTQRQAMQAEPSTRVGRRPSAVVIRARDLALASLATPIPTFT
jgi:hypothetical protein